VNPNRDVQLLGQGQIGLESFVSRLDSLVLNGHLAEDRIPASLEERAHFLCGRRPRTQVEKEAGDNPVGAGLVPLVYQRATGHADDVPAFHDRKGLLHQILVGERRMNRVCARWILEKCAKGGFPA
jgi:hypothetical protein